MSKQDDPKNLATDRGSNILKSSRRGFTVMLSTAEKLVSKTVCPRWHDSR